MVIAFLFCHSAIEIPGHHSTSDLSQIQLGAGLYWKERYTFHCPGKDVSGMFEFFPIPGLSRTIRYMWSPWMKPGLQSSKVQTGSQETLRTVDRSYSRSFQFIAKDGRYW